MTSFEMSARKTRGAKMNKSVELMVSKALEDLSVDENQWNEIWSVLCAEASATKSRFTRGKHRVCEFLQYPTQRTGTGIKKTYCLAGQGK